MTLRYGQPERIIRKTTGDDGAYELLCVKPGKGTLALDGAPLVLKEAKPLPASD